MRFLCLHGIGSSSEVLEWQTAALRSKLGSHHEFEFICGSHPFPQTPEIQDIFPRGETYWAYTDPYKPDTVIPFLADLTDFIESEGPFDVLLGFSQGAELASTFLIHQQQEDLSSSIKCAIFICGLAPWLIQGSQVAKMTPGVRDLISIPTAHILARKDAFYSQGQDLLSVCNSHNREVLEHDGTHDIPRGAKITSDMALVIAKTIEKSLWLQ